MFRFIRLGVMKKGVVTQEVEPNIPISEGCFGPPEIDVKECKACGRCISSCPVGAISLAQKCLSIDLGRCIYCGACARDCPLSISMSKMASRSSMKREGLWAVYRLE